MENDKRFQGREIRPKFYLISMCASACFAVFGSLMNYENTTPTPPAPFITELGKSYPGSLIFSVFLNLTAVFGFICVHNFHGILTNSQILGSGEQRLNDASLITGFTMFLGMIMFTSGLNQSQKTPHVAGLVLFVASFFLYGTLKCYLSYSTLRKLRKESRRNIIIRFTVFALALVSCVVLIVFQPPDSRQVTNASALWSRGYKPGYRLVAVVAEWIMWACMVGFFLTFYGDLQYVRYGELEENLNKLIEDEPCEVA